MSVDYVMIKGFTITNGGSWFNAGIRVDGDYATITDNNILGNGNYGIYLYYSSNNNISNNIVSGCTANGINLFYSSSNRISGNTISKNFYGICLSYSNNNEISGNTVSENDHTAVIVSSCDHNKITGNEISENGGYGIYFEYDEDNLIQNNIISNNDGVGIYIVYPGNNKIVGNSISGNGGSGIYLVYSDNNNVSGNNIFGNGDKGIYLFELSGTYIYGNNISENSDDGIYIRKSINNSVCNNKISENAQNGIYLYSSSNNNVMENNIIVGNGNKGIDLYYSNNNKIHGNAILDNSNDGICLYQHSDNNTIENNIASGNSNNGVYLWKSSNNSIENNTLSKNGGNGISFESSSNNNKITNNVISANDCYGVYMVFSSNNSVTNNIFQNNSIMVDGDDVSHWNTHTIKNNTANGRPIYYYKDANGITVPSDTISVILANCTNIVISGINADGVDVGVVLGYSCNCMVEHSTISRNDQIGIYLSNSNNNKLIDDTITENNYGIYLWESCNNEICGNTILGNDYGLCVDGTVMGSNNNRIYHNNFINNAHHAGDCWDNIWNLSKPDGGNYWDDWTWPDADNDGFVDSPRAIDGGLNYDYLPFAQKYGWDKEPPSSFVRKILPYWHNSTISITVNASDASSGVMKVELYYRYSSDNSTWEGWSLLGENTTGNPTYWNFSFNFPNGTGYYEFVSVAWDNAGNHEVINWTEPSNAARAGYDDVQPTLYYLVESKGFVINNIYPENYNIILNATATIDNISGVRTVVWVVDGVEYEGAVHTIESPTAGTYGITLRAEDLAGNLNSTSFNITVGIDTDGDGYADAVDNDDDNDGMPDYWEQENGLNPKNASDAAEDPDNDDLANLEEFKNGTDPNDSDTDGDGMPDGWEVKYNLNATRDDANEDADGDGTTNIDEYKAGTDPLDPSSKPSKGERPTLWPYILIGIVVIVAVVLLLVFVMRGRKPDTPMRE